MDIQKGKTLKFPLLSGKESQYPKDFICPICKKKRACEPHTFVSLSGGAYLMDRKEDAGGPSDDMDGFLYLNWHGAHDDGEGDYRETGGGISLVDRVRGGQYIIIACSTDCLRILLNQCIDKLESAMKKAKPLKKNEG